MLLEKKKGIQISIMYSRNYELFKKSLTQKIFGNTVIENIILYNMKRPRICKLYKLSSFSVKKACPRWGFHYTFTSAKIMSVRGKMLSCAFYSTIQSLRIFVFFQWLRTVSWPHGPAPYSQSAQFCHARTDLHQARVVILLPHVDGSTRECSMRASVWFLIFFFSFREAGRFQSFDHLLVGLKSFRKQLTLLIWYIKSQFMS